MAKLTVQFKDGETVSDHYADYGRMMDVVKFIVQGVTVEKVTIEL
jgi:hypothetical protein